MCVSKNISSSNHPTLEENFYKLKNKMDDKAVDELLDFVFNIENAPAKEEKKENNKVEPKVEPKAIKKTGKKKEDAAIQTSTPLVKRKKANCAYTTSCICEDCEVWISKYTVAIETLNVSFCKLAAKEMSKFMAQKGLVITNMTDLQLIEMWEKNMEMITKKIETTPELMRSLYSHWSDELTDYCPSCAPGAHHLLSIFQDKPNVIQTLMDCDYSKRTLCFTVVRTLRNMSGNQC